MEHLEVLSLPLAWVVLGGGSRLHLETLGLPLAPRGSVTLRVVSLPLALVGHTEGPQRWGPPLVKLRVSLRLVWVGRTEPWGSRSV